MKTLTKVQRRVAKIETLYKEIAEIQAGCKHEAATKKAGANTGNYDPSCNSYWYDYTCPECQKRWREDQ